MKFVPTLCAAAALLLLSACSPPASETERAADETQIVVGSGMPKPTQTTWSTPEPTPTETAKSDVEPSDAVLDECERLDKTILFRFRKSGVKCAQVLELRAQFVEKFGEEKADGALLAYHSENCTENAGEPEGEQLPYNPSEKSHGEVLLYKVEPGESKTPTGSLEDGERRKFAPCVSKQ